jgi:hypothetical protein
MGGQDDHATINQMNHSYWNLSITDPRCMNSSCRAFVIGYNASQSRYSNDLYLNFGLWTVFFYCALVAIFTSLHVRHRILDVRWVRSMHYRSQGCWRFITYRRLHGRLGEHLDLSYGILTLLAAATVFLSVLPFYQGFFLREEFRFGSPPLSVRCAMMAAGLTPILMLLAGKMVVSR